MHLTVHSILVGAAVAATIPTRQPPPPLQPPLPEWHRFPDPPGHEVLQCEHLVNELLALGNAYYRGDYRADEPPPPARWHNLTTPVLPYADLQKCQDIIDGWKEKTYRWPREVEVCGVVRYRDCLWARRVHPNCEDELGAEGKGVCRPDMKRWIIDYYGPKVIDHYKNHRLGPGTAGNASNLVQARQAGTIPPPPVGTIPPGLDDDYGYPGRDVPVYQPGGDDDDDDDDDSSEDELPKPAQNSKWVKCTVRCSRVRPDIHAHQNQTWTRNCMRDCLAEPLAEPSPSPSNPVLEAREAEPQRVVPTDHPDWACDSPRRGPHCPTGDHPNDPAPVDPVRAREAKPQLVVPDLPPPVADDFGRGPEPEVDGPGDIGDIIDGRLRKCLQECLSLDISGRPPQPISREEQCKTLCTKERPRPVWPQPVWPQPDIPGPVQARDAHPRRTIDGHLRDCLRACWRAPPPADGTPEIIARELCRKRCFVEEDSPGEQTVTTTDPPIVRHPSRPAGPSWPTKTRPSRPEVTTTTAAALDPSIDCILACLRGPIRHPGDSAAIAECARRCTEGDKGGNETETSTSTSSTSTPVVTLTTTLLDNPISTPVVTQRAVVPAPEATDTPLPKACIEHCMGRPLTDPPEVGDWMTECRRRCSPDYDPSEDLPRECISDCHPTFGGQGLCLQWCLPDRRAAWRLRANETKPAADGSAHEARDVDPEGLPAAAGETPPACIFDCLTGIPEGDDQGRRECLSHCRPMMAAAATTSNDDDDDEEPTAASSSSALDDDDAGAGGLPFLLLKAMDPMCRLKCIKNIPRGQDDRRRACLDRCGGPNYGGSKPYNRLAAAALAVSDDSPLAREELGARDGDGQHPGGPVDRNELCKMSCRPSGPVVPEHVLECRKRCDRKYPPEGARRDGSGLVGRSDGHEEARDKHPWDIFGRNMWCKILCIPKQPSIPEDGLECRERCDRLYPDETPRDGNRTIGRPPASKHEEARDTTAHRPEGLEAGNLKCILDCFRNFFPGDKEERRECLSDCRRKDDETVPGGGGPMLVARSEPDEEEAPPHEQPWEVIRRVHSCRIKCLNDKSTKKSWRMCEDLCGEYPSPPPLGGQGPTFDRSDLEESPEDAEPEGLAEGTMAPSCVLECLTDPDNETKEQRDECARRCTGRHLTGDTPGNSEQPTPAGARARGPSEGSLGKRQTVPPPLCSEQCDHIADKGKWLECLVKLCGPFEDPETAPAPRPTVRPLPMPGRPGLRPRTSQEEDQDEEAPLGEHHHLEARGGVVVEKRDPKCTSKCLRGPPKTPRERHECIRHCVRRSLD